MSRTACLAILLFLSSCCDKFDTPYAAEAAAARACALLGKEVGRTVVTQIGQACFELTDYKCLLGSGLPLPPETQENWL